MAKNAKTAETDHAVHALIGERWSPYGFDSRPVAPDDLRSLFEAARWAPSSFNEQPWSFIVAASGEAPAHGRILSCLMEANQAWAAAAPVLGLAITSSVFSRNGKPNRHAEYDLGQAVANLATEATARGLSIHQMAGFDPERARELFSIPDGHEAMTAFTLGYAAAAGSLPAALAARDTAARARKPLTGMLFGAEWGTPLT